MWLCWRSKIAVVGRWAPDWQIWAENEYKEKVSGCMNLEVVFRAYIWSLEKDMDG